MNTFYADTRGTTKPSIVSSSIKEAQIYVVILNPFFSIKTLSEWQKKFKIRSSCLKYYFIYMII